MEHRFDLSRTAPATMAALTSEPFLRAFAQEVGVTVTDLASETAAGGVARSSMLWAFSTSGSGIPQIARRLLPERVQLRWEQAWGPLVDQRATGTLEVALLGRPSATCTGRTELVGDGGTTTLSTTTRTQSSLPRPLAAPIESMIDRELVGWILSVQARVLQRS